MQEQTWTVRCGKACRCALSGGVPKRFLAAAIVVETILNLINQGDALLGGAPVNRRRCY